MILNLEQIKTIVLTNPNKALVTAGKLYNKKLRTHFYGEHLEGELQTVEGYEKEALRKLRVKYTRSNKDLMNRVSRPMDKVFSARGSSVYHNLPEAQDKKARELSKDIRSGYSIRKWIESFWKPHYRDDPNGMIFLEIAQSKKLALLKSRNKSFVYPTYKSICSVYDYLPSGASLEYVVFHVDENEKKAAGIDPAMIVYRVVDDAYDYFVRQEGQEVTVLNEHSYPNLFMYVPGILCGDIPNPNMDGNMLSFFDEIIELANQFLLKGSIQVTHDFMHGFPKYWEYADDCSDCAGTKFKDGKDCPTCKGSGKRIMSNVSDVKLLTYPQDKTDAIVTPNVAGYVEPSEIYYNISTASLQLLEDLMTYTLWGASSQPQSKGMSTDQGSKETKTATQVINDIKPQSDRLEPVTDCAEKRHKFVLDGMIRIMIVQSYPGASVNYGKRYMIESPDVLWEKYSDARIKGAAMSVLDDLLLEYYEAKYNSDPVKLAIQTKLLKVEPFVHLTAIQVQPLMVTELDFYKKAYFGEWLSTLNEAMILNLPQDVLVVQLEAYAMGKVAEVQKKLEKEHKKNLELKAKPIAA